MKHAFYEVDGDSVPSDSADNCESFLQSYARGHVDCPGVEPPDDAFAEINADILLSGQWPAPEPPNEDHRVRELYSPRRPSLPLSPP
jgi:hypothetical protein